MESIEKDLTDLLQSKCSRKPPAQLDAYAGDPDFTPHIKTDRNAAYIVCGVIFNKSGELLLKEEAKDKMRHSWYLPSGKVKAEESLEAAIKREVESDTGYQIEPTMITSVECKGPQWFRFTYSGKIIGGERKTDADADNESIQAKFFTLDTVQNNDIKLRCDDMLTLVDAALACYNSQPKIPILSLTRAHRSTTYRLVLLCTEYAGGKIDRVHVLTKENPQPHFPSVGIGTGTDFITLVHSVVYKEAFDDPEFHTHTHGILMVEYGGAIAMDDEGICFTVLVTCRELHIIKNTHYKWVPIKEKKLQENLLARLEPGMTILLMDNI